MRTFELNASLILINSTLKLKKHHLIWKDEIDGEISFGRTDFTGTDGYTPQILCAVIDSKIELNDYYLNSEIGGIYIATAETDFTSLRENKHIFKKVVAISEELNSDSPIIDMKTIQSYIEKPFTEVTIKYEKYDYHPEIVGGVWDGESYEYKIRPVLTPTFELVITPKKQNWIRSELPIDILKNMMTYCEDQAIYDKLGKYGDFYYKAKNWLKQNE